MCPSCSLRPWASASLASPSTLPLIVVALVPQPRVYACLKPSLFDDHATAGRRIRRIRRRQRTTMHSMWTRKTRAWGYDVIQGIDSDDPSRVIRAFKHPTELAFVDLNTQVGRHANVGLVRCTSCVGIFSVQYLEPACLCMCATCARYMRRLNIAPINSNNLTTGTYVYYHPALWVYHVPRVTSSCPGFVTYAVNFLQHIL